ncbi:MAG: VanZ family protein [Propionibacteriaceae bacterium]|nr:VanZ family protein [Propionibacteriaceae bacterium]
MGNFLMVWMTSRVLGSLAMVVLLAAGLTWLLRGRLRRPVCDPSAGGELGRPAGQGETVGLPTAVRRSGIPAPDMLAPPRVPQPTRHARPALFFLFLVSLGLVLVVTLLREPWTGACWECLAEWHPERVLTGRVGAEVWLNIVLFVPAALFATLLWRAPWRTVGIALLLSLAIEIVQPLVGVGANDVMDLVANTSGALIGAGAGAVLLLVGDLIRRRPVGLGRVARVVLSVGLGVAVLFGGPAWAATIRQAATVERLEKLFAGTTLADYEAHRDGAWDDKLYEVYTESGRPTMTGRNADGVARERFTWNIYFAVRCVVAEWTPDDFTAVPLSGAVCTAPLAAVPK